jgi:hypothetical protein
VQTHAPQQTVPLFNYLAAQATDLAAQNPAKLKELQDLFHQEAIKFGV